MRAVTVREYGGTPAVAEIPTPEPGARQILIRRAAGMNPNCPTTRSTAAIGRFSFVR
jgi:NADPH:quinone reductase-like Zn-dependent oxidoreductase